MFAHSDRLPTGTPLPTGTLTPTPWGVRRMAPYPSPALGYAKAVLDPTTQTTRYFDDRGKVIEMGGHGTSTGTNPSTGTSPDGTGSGTDTDTGNDTDQ
ncbi:MULTISPECIES: putative ATP-grasp-modified RiPP [unclassified Streptomyces]|uniref:putative ATP-grasp-modified RiPP n=1 Tax=unclassified Streptomyces TaxID=2593676 RepID=UPI0024413DAF|nr:putative ATP-grasp-modified RiPP [Streptomyces sp. DH41]MDG9722543.1 putative ATP-grasp-modified RiPP [Streptomyces sp. DH41]